MRSAISRPRVKLMGTLGVVAGLALAVAPVGASPGRAISDQTGPTEMSVAMTNQARLDEVAGQIEAIVDPSENSDPVPIDGAVDNFAGLSVSGQTNTLTLYWVGDLPAPIDAIVQSARSNGMTVDIEQASFSQNAVSTAMKAVEKLITTGAMSASFRLDEEAPRVDGSGIDLTVSSINDSTDTSGLNADIKALTNVPVRVQSYRAGGNPNRAILASRQNDATPWKGGAGNISLPTPTATQGEYCTSGVGVTANASGNDYVLTAAHCVLYFAASTGDTYDANGDYLGVWSQASTRLDADIDDEILKPSSGASSPLTYYDVYNSNVTTKVLGVGTNNVGDTYCVEGAMSGEHCNVVVSKKSTTYTDNKGQIHHYAMKASAQPAGGGTNIAVAAGDSGGPVLDWSPRLLQGLVQSGFSVVTCVNTVDPSTICYNGIYFSSSSHVMSSLNISLHS